MFMLKCLPVALAVTLSSAAAQETPQLGQAADPALVKAWDTDIFADGSGLPPGSGTAAQGKRVYERHCQTCHGVDGSGNSADELAGARHVLTDNPPDKTIGNYWPYATTVFDFTRRAMPLDKPGTLSDDEVYAVTAYLLRLNKLIGENDIIDASTLPQVKMPNRNGFIDVYGEEKAGGR